MRLRRARSPAVDRAGMLGEAGKTATLAEADALVQSGAALRDRVCEACRV